MADASQQPPVKDSFHRPATPLHPSHFLILATRWRRLGQAVAAIVLMVSWVGFLRNDAPVLTGVGCVAAFLALTLTAVRDEKLGFRGDAWFKLIVFLVFAFITVMLVVIDDREERSSGWFTGPGESDEDSYEFYREPAFFGFIFVLTMGVLAVTRAVGLLRWHLQLAVRPLTLDIDDQGLGVRTLRGRAFVRWRHLELVSVAGTTLVLRYRPEYPESERPKLFTWWPALGLYRVADLLHYSGDPGPIVRSLTRHAGDIVE